MPAAPTAPSAPVANHRRRRPKPKARSPKPVSPSVPLHEREPRHLLADPDHRDPDHHDQHRGDVVASREVVERLLEEEQAAEDERDGETFEEVTADHRDLTGDGPAAGRPS